MKATEIVQARLFPKLRRSGDKRKTKSKAAHGKQFGSYYQIGYHRLFNDTTAILERVANMFHATARPWVPTKKFQPNLTPARSPEKYEVPEYPGRIISGPQSAFSPRPQRTRNPASPYVKTFPAAIPASGMISQEYPLLNS